VNFKPIEWIGRAQVRLSAFPYEAKREAGHQLWLVQLGRMPEDWKHMADVGLGVIEIRIHEPNEYRVLYIAKYDEAVYVLHAFGKRTQRTPQKDLKIARQAYAKVQDKKRIKE
jgi:phage-related protein